MSSAGDGVMCVICTERGRDQRDAAGTGVLQRDSWMCLTHGFAASVDEFSVEDALTMASDHREWVGSSGRSIASP